MYSYDNKKGNKRSSGFSVIELLVSMFLSLIILSLSLGTVIANKNVLGKDTARTKLNQSLRGALDIIGLDLRVSGENLPTSFPAIEIVDGSGTSADQLFLKRNLLNEVLPLCTQINQGTTVTQITFGIPGTTPAGCVYSGQTHNYNAWRTYRLANNNQVDAYIYDRTAKVGEFFKYTSETDTGTNYRINRTAGTWAHTYPTASSAIYILEQWKFALNTDLIQLTKNNDTANPLTVAFGITNFQAEALMQDGTTKASFTVNDQWSQISQVSLSITGRERFRRQNIDRTVAAQFFPRNILSF